MRAPETHPQAVSGHGTELGPIDARGEEQNARFLDEPARELFDALRAPVADEADAAAVGLAPVDAAGAAPCADCSGDRRLLKLSVTGGVWPSGTAAPVAPGRTVWLSAERASREIIAGSS